MSSLLFLTSEDFVLVNGGQSGNILQHEIGGITLILFYSNQCPYCQQLIPIFKHIPDTISGCQFGMVNVSMNRSLISMAVNTSTPITHVPLMILYVNGKPYMKYDGRPTTKDIINFVVEVSNKAFESEFTSRNRREIPSYTVGQPLWGQTDVCYLEFDEDQGYKKPH